MEVSEDLVAKTGLREHTLDCSPDQFSGPLCEDLLGRGEALSTRISGVAGIHAVGHLVSLEGDFLGVDDDDVVTAVDVGSEAGLVLATEDKSDAGSKAAKRKICSINDDPLFVHSRFVQRYCLVA